MGVLGSIQRQAKVTCLPIRLDQYQRQSARHLPRPVAILNVPGLLILQECINLNRLHLGGKNGGKNVDGLHVDEADLAVLLQDGRNLDGEHLDGLNLDVLHPSYPHVNMYHVGQYLNES